MENLSIRRQQRRILKKQTSNELNVFSSCDTLPAYRFFHILKTADYRYLLDIKHPEKVEYFEHLLLPIWDDILTEYDNLNGDKIFTNSLLDINSDLQEYNDLIIMRACCNLMSIGSKKGLKYLSEIGIDYEDITIANINDLKRRIALLDTNLQIKRLANDDKKDNKDFNFIQAVVSYSNILGRQIDKDRTTVSEWIFISAECRKIVEARSKKSNEWQE